MNTDKFSKKDEKYKETINLLKNLPRVNAPENFEFNLMTRIQNKNFGFEKTQSGKRIFSWKLAPAAALVLTAVILFFVIDRNTLETENTFVNDSPQKMKSSDLKPDTVEFEEVVLESTSKPESTTGRADENSVNEGKSDNKVLKREQYRVVLQPNDAISKEKIDFPFDKDSGVELDNFIGLSTTSSTSNSPTSLIRKGTGNDFLFNGFYLRMHENEKMMLELRSEMDSMWKIQKQKDSLKRLDTARVAQ